MRLLSIKYTGKLWPNGEFGVSRIREAPFPSLCESHHETAETQFNRLGIKAHGVEAVLRFRNKLEAVMHPGLSIRPNSHISAKRGSRGITAYGRKLVRNCAAELEERYKKELLSFATVTIPNVPQESALQIARNWSEIVKQFAQNLRRGLRRLGLPDRLLLVTEIQEERAALWIPLLKGS